MRIDRVVLNTNILISAVLTKGKPFEVLEWVLANSALVFSDATFDEFAQRLQKSKFDRYVSRRRREEVLADVEAIVDWVTITGTVQACKDPDDDKFLETALVAQARYIVTGGADLLVLNPFEGVRIVAAADFLEVLSNSPDTRDVSYVCLYPSIAARPRIG